MHEELFEAIDGPGCRCVIVRGDIDLSNAKALATVMDKGAANGPLVVDLSDCTYLDSTGLSVLVKYERNHRGNLVIVAPPAQASLRILEITGLALTFTIAPSRADALPIHVGQQLSANRS